MDEPPEKVRDYLEQVTEFDQAWLDQRTNIVPAEAARLITRMPRLRHLEIANCTAINDETGLKPLLDAILALEHLERVALPPAINERMQQRIDKNPSKLEHQRYIQARDGSA